MPLPDTVDEQKLQRGWIEDPIGKAKSVALTEEGERLVDDLLDRHFGRSPKA